MTMKKLALVVCVLAACGGKKGGSTTPPPTEETTGTTENRGTGGGEMVSADTMEEIQRMFQRKGNAVSRCLAVVVDNKELPKNSRGKITLEVTIATSGKVDAVKIIKASLESKPLHDCVIERVKEIQFPTVPQAYPTTYTYAFEAM
jgi:ABC-type glycerol-3-phosphate transport system substrate-binding protein